MQESHSNELIDDVMPECFVCIWPDADEYFRSRVIQMKGQVMLHVQGYA